MQCITFNTMAKTITTRLPDEFVKDLKRISDAEHLDTSSVLRRLLAESIKDWKENYAVEMYKKGEFSFGQVAEFVKISLWDVPSLLKKYGAHINYDEEELNKDLENIGWK